MDGWNSVMCWTRLSVHLRFSALTANEVNERSDRTPPGPSTPMSPSVATNNREQEINIVVLREELQQKVREVK